eukprot:CAMPEP_0170446486 /NCGR_PEP_ID=MMETSP0117_2-20130122/49632_1 /TAXON_ID=400756 /ORGANISM="Durinskia baltica, Strain CSIRO CS-38" /LENGTH=319 /DNA_ID=CAMNT_0010707455 /DNA_START=44 /DNA_END=1005 /DNA_ORIENTATION=-
MAREPALSMQFRRDQQHRHVGDDVSDAQAQAFPPLTQKSLLQHEISMLHQQVLDLVAQLQAERRLPDSYACCLDEVRSLQHNRRRRTKTRTPAPKALETAAPGVSTGIVPSTSAKTKTSVNDDTGGNSGTSGQWCRQGSLGAASPPMDPGRAASPAMGCRWSRALSSGANQEDRRSSSAGLGQRHCFNEGLADGCEGCNTRDEEGWLISAGCRRSPRPPFSRRQWAPQAPNVFRAQSRAGRCASFSFYWGAAKEDLSIGAIAFGSELFRAAAPPGGRGRLRWQVVREHAAWSAQVVHRISHAGHVKSGRALFPWTRGEN